MAKINEELIQKFATEIEDGMPFTYTCDLLEISFVTAQNWMKQGEADIEAGMETLNAQFFKSIKKAYARFIKATKKRIYNGENGWTGAAWWLERTNKLFVITNDEGTAVEPVVVNPIVSKKK